MRKKNGYELNFIKILLQKYISVLLAAFVLVLGMVGTIPVFATADQQAAKIHGIVMNNVNQAADAIGNMVAKQVAEALMADVLEPINSLDDQLVIEGSQNLKHIEKGEDGVFKGEIVSLSLFEPFDARTFASMSSILSKSFCFSSSFNTSYHFKRCV